MTELYDPFDKEWLKYRYDYYEKIRNLDTAYWSEKYKMYIYVNYDDVRYILTNPIKFISGKGNLIKEVPERFGRTPGASDGKAHDHMRSIVKDAYSKSRINAINEVVRNKTIELLELEKDSDEIEISDIVRTIAAYMIAETLNLPFNKNYIAELLVAIQLYSSWTVLHNHDNTDYDELVAIIRDLISRKVIHEGDGIYQEFMKKRDKNTSLSLFIGPAISGCYSLISALQFLVINLANEGVLPELLANRELESKAIDEDLRFTATTGKFRRTVTEPMTLNGIDLKPDDVVGVCLDAALRDPKVFPDANTFNMHRENLAKSTPFGVGPHACAGQAIAKSALGAFLTPFLDIIGNYEVVTKDFDYIITASGNNDVIDKIFIRRINS